MSDQEFVMSSRRPYLMRAVYEWILDNDCTPFVLVDAAVPGVDVPEHYAQDGKIVLNVSPSAVRGFNIDNERVEFSARFNGRSLELSFPVAAVLAIYARENGEGMVLEPVMHAEAADDSDFPSAEQGQASAGPALVLVGDQEEESEPVAAANSTVEEASSETVDSEGPDDEPPTTPPPSKGRPALRVVK